MKRVVTSKKSLLIKRIIRVSPALIGILGCIVLAKESEAIEPKISPEELTALMEKCAPEVDVSTLSALVNTESSLHPFAIAVVNGPSYYPKTIDEAQKLIDKLDKTDKSYSVGLGQINRSNFKKFGTNGHDLLEPCLNLSTSAKVLSACYKGAYKKFKTPNLALEAALSCYYSGNYETGKKAGYVSKVVANSTKIVPSIEIITRNQQEHKEQDSYLLISTESSRDESGPII